MHDVAIWAAMITVLLLPPVDSGSLVYRFIFVNDD